MKKLAALSIAVSISATLLGMGKPASANQIIWRFLGYNSSYTTAYFYDENYLSRSGDVVVVRVKAMGKAGFLGLSCSRRMYTTSLNGKTFASPSRINSGTAASMLYKRFC